MLKQFDIIQFAPNQKLLPLHTQGNNLLLGTERTAYKFGNADSPQFALFLIGILTLLFLQIKKVQNFEMKFCTTGIFCKVVEFFEKV